MILMILRKSNSASASLLQREQFSLPPTRNRSWWLIKCSLSIWLVLCVSLPWRHRHLQPPLSNLSPARRISAEGQPCIHVPSDRSWPSRATFDLEDRAVHKNHLNRKIWRPHTRSPASQNATFFQENLLNLHSHAHGNPLLHPRLSQNKDNRVRRCFKTELISFFPLVFLSRKNFSQK